MTETRNPASLETSLPKTLDGWEIHDFTAADIGILTGATVSKTQAEGHGNQACREAFGMVVTPGVTKVDLALYKGDASIRMTAIQLATSGGMATKALQMQSSFMNMLSDAQGEGPRLSQRCRGAR